MAETTIEQDMSLVARVEGFVDVVERAAEHFRNKGKGGVQVPYHDDFASVTPSTLRELEWWTRTFKSALESNSAKYCLDTVKSMERMGTETHFKHQALEVIRSMRAELGPENAMKLLKEIAAIKPWEVKNGGI